MNNEKEPALSVKLLEKQFDTNNFNVLGLSLDTASFNDIASKLGKANVVERGDASYSRSQICYVSVEGPETVHLIFEGGEGGSSTFYLFQGGADWNGSNLCVKSKLVSEHLVTGTGLKLGLSRRKVEAILGKPDFAEGERIAYCREFQKKATREKGAPQTLVEPVPVSIQIEARFRNDAMNYFFVSTTSSQ